MITFGPIIGHVFRCPHNTYGCRIVLETLNPQIDIEIFGSHSKILY